MSHRQQMSGKEILSIEYSSTGAVVTFADGSTVGMTARQADQSFAASRRREFTFDDLLAALSGSSAERQRDD